MSTPATQSFLFPGLSRRPVHVEFTEDALSSNGGGPPLKAVDGQLGLTEALTACLRDGRQASNVKHGCHDALRQRVYGIALGHPDANDATALSGDPVHELLLDRDPIGGQRLASQPTISRWGNSMGAVDLLEMSTAYVQTVLGRHERRRTGPPIATIRATTRSRPVARVR